jgi:putative acetyltransferase
MNVRPHESPDLPRVAEISTAAIHSLAAPFYSPEQLAAWAPANPDLQRWRQRLAELQTVVAEEDGVSAGFASWRSDGYLDLLFTHPRFARRGVATGLYLHIEDALRQAGVPRVFTHASLAARPFFDRHGFRVEAEELVECRGVYLRRFRMNKLL